MGDAVTDIANLTPEESFKAGLPLVLALEARIAAAEHVVAVMGRHSPIGHEAVGEARAYRDALALVTAKDADRDLDQ